MTVNLDELPKGALSDLLPNLPDSAVLESSGNRTSAGEVRNRLVQQLLMIASKQEKFGEKAQAELTKRRSVLHAQEEARLAAVREEAIAEFKKISASSPVLTAEARAIQKQVSDLEQRAAMATSPAEHEELIRQGNELVRRYSIVTDVPSLPGN